MCCLFGVYSYGDVLKQGDVKNLISALSLASTARGMDATGISFLYNNKIEIQKSAKSAYEFKFNLPDKVKTVIGHTRLATQGSSKYNPNNHPFLGKIKGKFFALAHNGIITNDRTLRIKHSLPATKIQTDSYVAVQMLEKYKLLTMDSIKQVVEDIEGSFCFTILDDSGNLYLIKGNNPLSVMHSKELKAYFYASTDQILWSGIVNSCLFPKFKAHITKKTETIEEIPLNEGEILKIFGDGDLQYKAFKIKELDYFMCFNRHRYRFADTAANKSTADAKSLNAFEAEYIEQLKDLASFMGFDECIVGLLLNEGGSLQDIEDYIYNHDPFSEKHNCLYDNEFGWKEVGNYV